MYGYMISLFTAYGFAAIISIYFVLKVPENSDEISFSSIKNTFKSLFFYGFQNQLAHIFQLMSFRLSYFLLESHVNKKAVGIYSNSLSIVESIWLITSSISLYQYSRISNSNDRIFARALTEKLLKLGLILALVAILFVLFIPADFYTWMFGADFHELSAVIRNMLPGIWVFNYALILGHYFSGISKYCSFIIFFYFACCNTILFKRRR